MSPAKTPSPDRLRAIAGLVEVSVNGDIPLIMRDADDLRALADSMETDDRDKRLADAGMKLVELEDALAKAEESAFEANAQLGFARYGNDMLSTEYDKAKRERDALSTRLAQALADLAVMTENFHRESRVSFESSKAATTLARKLRDARREIGELQDTIDILNESLAAIDQTATDAGSDADVEDEMHVVFRYIRNGVGLTPAEASDLAVQLAETFEWEIDDVVSVTASVLDEEVDGMNPENEGSGAAA